MIELIHRYENILNATSCDIISNYVLDQKKNNQSQFGEYIRPWHDNDTINWRNIENPVVKEIIGNYRIMITKLVSEAYQEQLYPNFTDLVLWRAGREMSFHKDDGYGNDGLSMRYISLVTYLNDNFIGGETVVLNQGSEVILRPSKGCAVSFTSDSRCTHRVNKIVAGVRVTLPMWFTRDIQHAEI